MHAELIFIGTELLLGEILNRNAQYLSSTLADHGIDVYFQTTVGDNMSRIEDTLRQAMRRARLVITTGGLGPTADDITRDAVAAAAGRPLGQVPALVEELENYFRHRGAPMSPNNLRQAMLPEGAEHLPNAHGTAPGIFLPWNDRFIVCLPGPPRELIPMVEGEMLPRLKAAVDWPRQTLYTRIFKVVGVPEATVDHKLSALMKEQSDVTLAPYSHGGEIHLRLAARADSAAEAEERFRPWEKSVREALGHHIFGTDDDTLPGVVGTLLKEAGWTVAAAESCTGGLLGDYITAVPGSSEYFLLGVTAYSNEAKENVLGVPRGILESRGAVSAETAAAMAGGVRRLAGSSVGISTTGIAGPGGGTEEKPVGTVFMAIDGPRGAAGRRFGLKGSRREIKLRTARLALAFLREYALGLGGGLDG